MVGSPSRNGSGGRTAGDGHFISETLDTLEALCRALGGRLEIVPVDERRKSPKGLPAVEKRPEWSGRLCREIRQDPVEILGRNGKGGSSPVHLSRYPFPVDLAPLSQVLGNSSSICSNVIEAGLSRRLNSLGRTGSNTRTGCRQPSPGGPTVSSSRGEQLPLKREPMS